MDEYSLVIAAIEILGALICLVSIIIEFIVGNKSKRLSRIIKLILFDVMIALISEGYDYVLQCQTTPAAMEFHKLVVWLCYTAYIAVGPLTCELIRCLMPPNNSKMIFYIRSAIYLISGIGAALLVSNIFIPWVFYIDEENSLKTAVGNTIFAIVFLVTTVLIGVLATRYRKWMTKLQAYTTFIFVGIFFASIVLQLIFEESPGVSIAIFSGGMTAFLFSNGSQLSLKEERHSRRNMTITMYLFLMMMAGVYAIMTTNLITYRRTALSEAEKNSLIVAHMIDERIENYFIKPITVSITMAESSNLKHALENTNIEDEKAKEKSIIEYLASIKAGMDYQIVFAISDFSHKYYSDTGLKRILNPDNVEIDLWYPRFIDLGVDYSLTVDRDESNGMKRSLFINKRVYNERGKLLGVCGVGSSLERLVEIIEEYEATYGIDITIVDKNGLVKVDSDIDSVELLQIDSEYLSEVNSEEFYIEKTKNNICMTKYLEDLDWYLIITDSGEKVMDIFSMARSSFLVFAIISTGMLTVYIALTVNERKVGNILAEKERKEVRLNKLTRTDELTHLGNRYAFEEMKKHYLADGLPEHFSIIMVDINELKPANDTIGHHAGDELIVGASECMAYAIGRFGKIYRTGGDEFVILTEASKIKTGELVKLFREVVMGWHGQYVQKLSVSIGYACREDFPEADFNTLLNTADERMYVNKNMYYEITGHNRRKHV